MDYTRETFENLPRDAAKEQIELTAQGLERHHYEPMMIMRTPGFIRWTKEDILREYDRITGLLPDDTELAMVKDLSPQEVVEKQLGMLLYHYRLLCRLRQGEAAAWDVVNELYEDD